MEEAARLKERLSSLGELRNVIHAIRGIAASRIQEAQSALAGIRNYVDIVEDAISQAASLAPGLKQAYLAPEVPSASALVVVCSEHGFVGGYNEEVLDHAQDRLDHSRGRFCTGMLAVGNLVEERLADHALPLLMHVHQLVSRPLTH